MKNNNTIRLNEKDLNRIITESVYQVLSENEENEGFWNNLKTGAKTFVSNQNNGGGLKGRWENAKKNFNTQGEYDNINQLITLLTKLLDERKISPQTTVAQLVGGKYNNNKFGTMSGMANNRIAQMKRRGLQ